MTPRLRRSFIVRVLQIPQRNSTGHLRAEPRFVVHDLKTGEERGFADWEELRGFLERNWVRQLR